MTAINEHSVSYSEALALLEQARDLDAFVDEQGISRSNSWEVRRALQCSKRLYAEAQAVATLAVADEVRRLRDSFAVGPITLTTNGTVDVDKIRAAVAAVFPGGKS